jgi:hypothetical protein
MAAKKTAKAAPKSCPPGHHRMPDGSCMPDSEMPTRARKTSGTPARPARRRTRY